MPPAQDHQNPLFGICTSAIRQGNPDLLSGLLQPHRQAAPGFLGQLVHEVLDAPPFHVLARFGDAGARAAMPKSAAIFEANLGKMVELLARRGADFTTADKETGQSAAQRAFDNSAGDRGPPGLGRWSACVQIVRSTLQQVPDWQPDITLPFRTLACAPTDPHARSHRQDISAHIHSLASATTRWLGGNSPEAIAQRLCMTDEARTYWTLQRWRHNESDMPWMDMKASPQSAWQNSGLAFAFGTKSPPPLRPSHSGKRGNGPKAQ